MITNDTIMKKLEDMEKQLQEQNEQLEQLISLIKKEGYRNIKITTGKIKPIVDDIDIPEPYIEKLKKDWDNVPK